MKEKKLRIWNILNSKPVIGCFIFIILGLASVLAGNVIVQDGAIEVGDDLNASGVLFVDQSTGKVGIGTTNPTHELNVIGYGNITGYLALGRGQPIIFPIQGHTKNVGMEAVYSGGTTTCNTLCGTYTDGVCLAAWRYSGLTDAVTCTDATSGKGCLCAYIIAEI